MASLPIVMLLSLIPGFLLGFIVAVLDLNKNIITVLTVPIGFAIGSLISVFVFKLVLKKEFREFKIGLIKKIS